MTLVVDNEFCSGLRVYAAMSRQSGLSAGRKELPDANLALLQSRPARGAHGDIPNH